MRPHYAYYAQHAFRFYFNQQGGEPTFLSLADELNWKACNKAASQFSDQVLSMLRQVYTLRDTIPDNVYQVAKENGINQNDLWTLMAMAEKRFAQERDLI